MSTAIPSLPRVSSIAVKSISSLTGLLSLRERDTHSLDLGVGERCHLLVGIGAAWITMEGNPDDFTVTTDTPRIDFSGPGRLVIEAVGTGLAIQVTRTGRTNGFPRFRGGDSFS